MVMVLFIYVLSNLSINKYEKSSVPVILLARIEACYPEVLYYNSLSNKQQLLDQIKKQNDLFEIFFSSSMFFRLKYKHNFFYITLRRKNTQNKKKIKKTRKKNRTKGGLGFLLYLHFFVVVVEGITLIRQTCIVFFFFFFLLKINQKKHRVRTCVV